MAFVSSKGSHSKGGAHAAGKAKGAAPNSHAPQPSGTATVPGEEVSLRKSAAAPAAPQVRRQQISVTVKQPSAPKPQLPPEQREDQWRQIPVGQQSVQRSQASAGQQSVQRPQSPAGQQPVQRPQASAGQQSVQRPQASAGQQSVQMPQSTTGQQSVQRPQAPARQQPARPAQASPVRRAAHAQESRPGRREQAPPTRRERQARPPREHRSGVLGRVFTVLFLLISASALALVFFHFGVFRISYVLPGGSQATEYVLRGQTPDSPPEVVQEGYTFTGWTDSSGRFVNLSRLPVYEDQVLTARVMPVLSFWDHGAYLKLDENGLIHPDEPMLRGEAAEILCSHLSVPVPEDGGFSDVDASASYASAAAQLKALGAVSGERFRPEEPVTLRELLCMAVSFYPVLDWEELAVYPEPAEGEEEETPSPFDRSGPDPEGGYTLNYTFADVSQLDPDYARFCTAAAMGWVDYGPETELDANHALTRAQAAAVLNRIMGRGQNLELRREQTGSILDLPPSHPLYNQVMEAAVPHSGTLSEMGETWETSQPFTLDLAPGFFFLGTQLYCMGEDGYLVTDSTVDGFDFGPDGKYTSGMPELDELVQQVLGEIIQDGMTDMEKLRAAYNYTRDTFTYVKGSHYKRGDVSWAAQEAYAMLSTGHGNCYNFAGTFYELARALGQDATLISGLYGTNYLSHAWVEFTIDGERRLCDPEVEWTYLDNPELKQPDMFMMTEAYSNRWKYTV